MRPSTYAHGQLRRELLCLFSKGPHHGYQIIQLLQRSGVSPYVPSAGAVYPRIAKLQSEGLIEEVSSGRRRTFAITDRGREELAQGVHGRTRHREGAAQRTARQQDETLRAMLAELSRFHRRMVDEVLTPCASDSYDDAARARFEAALDCAGRSLRESVAYLPPRREDPTLQNRCVRHTASDCSSNSRGPIPDITSTRLEQRPR